MGELSIEKVRQGYKDLYYLVSYYDRDLSQTVTKKYLIGHLDSKNGRPILNNEYYNLININNELPELLLIKFPKINPFKRTEIADAGDQSKKYDLIPLSSEPKKLGLLHSISVPIMRLNSKCWDKIKDFLSFS
ncbi:MAG: hypothetical protein LBP22_03480 [Deltaproteobacteria bacterium]|jgi:hypothetical protein|nr:hypothetical protein [Deltaproteobacteria bacterium]